MRRFESYWGRFFEQTFRMLELQRTSLTCGFRTKRASPLPIPARSATDLSNGAGRSTAKATARKDRIPTWDSRPVHAKRRLPAGRLRFGTGVASGGDRRASLLSEPWQETNGLLSDLHGAWTAAFETSTGKTEAGPGPAEPEPEASL